MFRFRGSALSIEATFFSDYEEKFQRVSEKSTEDMFILFSSFFLPLKKSSSKTYPKRSKKEKSLLQRDEVKRIKIDRIDTRKKKIILVVKFKKPLDRQLPKKYSTAFAKFRVEAINLTRDRYKFEENDATQEPISVEHEYEMYEEIIDLKTQMQTLQKKLEETKEENLRLISTEQQQLKQETSKIEMLTKQIEQYQRTLAQQPTEEASVSITQKGNDKLFFESLKTGCCLSDSLLYAYTAFTVRQIPSLFVFEGTCLNKPFSASRLEEYHLTTMPIATLKKAIQIVFPNRITDSHWTLFQIAFPKNSESKNETQIEINHWDTLHTACVDSSLQWLSEFCSFYWPKSSVQIHKRWIPQPIKLPDSGIGILRVLEAIITYIQTPPLSKIQVQDILSPDFDELQIRSKLTSSLMSAMTTTLKDSFPKLEST